MVEIIEETPQDEPEGDAAAQAAVEEAGRQFLPLLKVGSGEREGAGGKEGHMGEARCSGKDGWGGGHAEARGRESRQSRCAGRCFSTLHFTPRAADGAAGAHPHESVPQSEACCL